MVNLLKVESIPRYSFIIMKKYWALILIIVLASILRLWQLNTLPYGIANDEVSYLYSSYSVWKTGHDVAGKFLPLSINLDSSLSPVPVYLTAPFVGILGLSPWSGRLPYALLSIGSVVLVYFLAELFFRNSKIALFSGLVMALSPWDILIGRGAWDGNMAVFFYLLGIYLFIRFLNKGNILWSIPAFLLAFYSYHGTKVFFVLLVPILIAVYWKELLQKKKQLLCFVGLCLFILVSFLFVVVVQGVSRQGTLMWNDPRNISDVVKRVNFYREKSTAPFIVREIVTSKLTILASDVLDNYFGAFSTQFLFRNGDIIPIYTYGTFFKGVMYVLDFPLLIAGIVFLARQKRRKESFLIAGLLFASPIPSAIGSPTTYLVRSMMMLPLLSIITGCGIYYVLAAAKKYRVTFILIAMGLVLGYIICVGLFLYRYIFQFNGPGAEFWNKSSRDVAEFVYDNKASYNKVYIASSTDKLLFQFAFFNKIDPLVFQHAYRTEKNIRTIGNVTFIPDCFNGGSGDPRSFLAAKTLYIVPNDCHQPAAAIVAVRDSNEPLRVIWKIYEKN